MMALNIGELNNPPLQFFLPNPVQIVKPLFGVRVAYALIIGGMPKGWGVGVY